MEAFSLAGCGYKEDSSIMVFILVYFRRLISSNDHGWKQAARWLTGPSSVLPCPAIRALIHCVKTSSLHLSPPAKLGGHCCISDGALDIEMLVVCLLVELSDKGQACYLLWEEIWIADDSFLVLCLCLYRKILLLFCMHIFIRTLSVVLRDSLSAISISCPSLCLVQTAKQRSW